MDEPEAVVDEAGAESVVNEASVNKVLDAILNARTPKELDKLRKLAEKDLPPVPFDSKILLENCIKLIHSSKTKEVQVILPVQLVAATKKNKANFELGNRKSPEGVIVKGDLYVETAFKPYAAARFDAFAMVRWLSTEFDVE